MWLILRPLSMSKQNLELYDAKRRMLDSRSRSYEREFNHCHGAVVVRSPSA